jgi:uncharacterized protein (TIGR04255 family)
MSEDTSPLGGLPPANRTLLAVPPIDLAIAEVRFSGSGAALPVDAGLQLFERLNSRGFDLAKAEQTRQQRIQINVQAGLAPTHVLDQGEQGWLLPSTDGTYQVTLMPSSFVFQASKYHRWSVTMRPRLAVLLDVVRELLDPAFVTRLGLRYVDRFVDRDANGPLSWKDRMADSFTGPEHDSVIGPMLRSSQQQIELDFGESKGALVRHGPFTDPAAGGATSYILDIDVFDNAPQRFEAASLVEDIEVLNRTAASLFQLSLKREYLESLQVAE